LPLRGSKPPAASTFARRSSRTGSRRRFRTTPPSRGILFGIVAAYVVVVTILGPENLGARFEQQNATFEEGAGHDETREEERPLMTERSSEAGSVWIDEKRDKV
jgi:hypothetical protein